MLNIFTRKTDSSNIQLPKAIDPKYEFYIGRIDVELDRLVNYYRNRERAVNNAHFLTRIVKQLTGSTTIPVLDYYRQVDTNARYISRMFDIVSNIHSGKILRNMLRRDNSPELFIYKNSEYDVFSYEDNWRDIESVKIIHNTNTDLDYELLYNTRKDTGEDSLTVYEIDLVSMCMQYYYWCKERRSLSSSTDANVFIATIVIPNILYSYTNVAIYNRFMTIARGHDNIDFELNHPIQVTDHSDNLDKYLAKSFDYLSNRTISVEQILYSILVGYDRTAMDVLKYSNKYPNLQSIWGLYVSRITHVADIVQYILGPKGIRYNKHILQDLPVILKDIERTRGYIENKLPEAVYEDYSVAVSYLHSKFGKR